MSEPAPRILRIGTCLAPGAMARRGAGWRRAEFPALAALITHPAGPVLFDTGYGQAFFEATRRLPYRVYRWLTPVRFSATDSLSTRLAAPPALVFLSHFHGDHVSGLFDLRDLPPVMASGAAIDGLAELGNLAALRAGCPPLLRDRLRDLTMTRAEDRPRIETGLPGFGTGHDLMGDGAIVAIPLPGHGIGQTGLYLPAARHFLIADAAYSRADLRQNTPPPHHSLRQLGDAAAYLDTFGRLRALMAARPDITLTPSHCPEAAT